MSIFDLLFILLFLTSVITLITAGVVALRGRAARSLHILRIFAICLAAYLGIVAIVALATPQRVLALQQERCSDDWCLAVESASHSPSADGISYSVTLKISSRARRVTQREKGVNVYLTDAKGRRFDPAPDPLAIPLDVLLEPGQSVRTRRSFTLPSDAHDIGLVTVHEGSFCFPGCFIIAADENPLHRRTIVRLD